MRKLRRLTMIPVMVVIATLLVAQVQHEAGYAATYTGTLRHGKIVYYESGKSRIHMSYSKIFKDGKAVNDGEEVLAYCVQPEKSTPPATSKAVPVKEISDTGNLAKAMYYSYGYPGWKKTESYIEKNYKDSFADKDEAYGLSHHILSTLYKGDTASDYLGWMNGSTHTLNKTYRSMLKDVRSTMLDFPNPPTTSKKAKLLLTSDKTKTVKTLEGEWREDLGMFKTQSVTLDADEANYVKIPVWVNTKLVVKHNNDAWITTKGKTLTYDTRGEWIKICAGDAFYILGTKGYAGNKYSKAYTMALGNYDPLLIKEAAGNQDMAVFAAINEDDEVAFTLKFASMPTGTLKLKKMRMTKDGKLGQEAGAKFRVWNDNYSTYEEAKEESEADTPLAAVLTSVSSGYTSCDLSPGTYVIRQVEGDSSYFFTGDRKVEIESDKTTVIGDNNELLNVWKELPIKIVKVDRETGETVLLSGFVFNVLDDAGKPVEFPGIGKDLVTDDSGTVTTPKTLPIGKYTVVETSAAEGYVVDATPKPVDLSTNAKYPADVTVYEVKMDNLPDPVIGTKARDSETGEELGIAAEKSRIIDTVSYEHLNPKKEYTLKGVLMEKETGKPLSDASGNAITAEKTFKPDDYKGEVELEFPEFNTELLSGSDLVVFENLYLEDEKVASHEDINDEGQTIHYPGCKTKAESSLTGTNQGIPGEAMKVTDIFTYSNLVPGKEYKVTGRLMYLSGAPVKDAAGTEITTEQSFVPEEKDGNLALEFQVPETSIGNESMVVYETLAYNGTTVLKHEDPSNKDQTIFIPKIGTRARSGRTGKNIGEPDGDSVIIDEVRYSGLVSGEKYIVKGVLMDKDTGRAAAMNGKEIRAEKSFVPVDNEGTVELEFNVEGMPCAGKTFVVFEKLFYQDREIATHEDIDDKGQTVIYPMADAPKNTPKPVSYEKPVPDTGDKSKILTYSMVGLIGILSLAFVARRKMD